MKNVIHYKNIDGTSKGFWGLLAFFGAIMLVGLAATYYMEHEGHWVTGMTNQIVWGVPHVFAVFLIVAASGALNVASIGSVFGRPKYKALGRLSGLLAITLLAGGLAVLLLDLGRPDRLIIAATYYNFKSIFALNIILYSGFFGLVGVYLWAMMDRSVTKYYKIAGFFAFIWRLILTTGTGSIFGFLVAREAYDAAIMAPLFIIMSFSFGMAIYILVLMAGMKGSGRVLGDETLRLLKNMLGVFVASVLYFVLVYHLTNLYATQHHGYEAFILLDGGIYTQLFWILQIGLGSLVPLGILFHPRLGKSPQWIGTAAVLVIIGGLAQMYIIIIGAQAYPLSIFPDYDIISSSFSDGIVMSYTPSIYEIALGLMGVAIALAMTQFAIKVLPFLPESLADEVIDPHHMPVEAETSDDVDDAAPATKSC
ncbi:MAG: polysulfide reductase NrfD [Gammaproteobacteria bacterium]|nr:MAG: polysulfide reductase NrfD [Gammaproteobacteria bacterium]